MEEFVALVDIYTYIHTHKVTQKRGTFEMRSGSHVQLAALRNRDLELQTTSPFSNHGSVERSTACCRHKKFYLFGFHQFLLGFQTFPFFCVTLYIYIFIYIYTVKPA
jgi:hypothetical protein